MNSVKSWLLGCLLAAAAAYGTPALSAPESGWWWNPAESGRGYFIESGGGVTFIGAFLYEADGHATWVVAGGANADPYNYTGPLYSTKNGQALFGPYVAPAAPDAVGTISLHFSDDTHGTLTWPGGTVAIERYVFGTGAADFQPDHGWWWNPNESGSGYAIEIQGDTLFFVGYMYDAGGRSVWYLSAGKMTSVASYNGDLVQVSNGQTMTGPYRAPDPPVSVGTVKIDFAAPDRATLTFLAPSARVSGLAPKRARPLATPGTVRETLIETMFEKTPPVEACPAKYLGTFLAQYSSTFANDVTAYAWSGAMIFDRVGPTCTYLASKGSVTINATADKALIPEGSCHLAGLATARSWKFAGMGIYSDDTWNTTFQGGLPVVPYTVTCTYGGATTTGSGTMVADLDFHTERQAMQNELPTAYADGKVTATEKKRGALWSYIKPLGVGSGYIRFAPLTRSVPRP